MTNEQILSGTLSSIARLGVELDDKERIIKQMQQVLDASEAQLKELRQAMSELSDENEKLKNELDALTGGKP